MSTEAVDPSLPRPTGLRLWLTAARPRTLPLAATPVLAGTALAWAEGAPHSWLVALSALLAAMLIQAGTNLHNDAADFERGADGADRLGPTRAAAAGWATPAQVRMASTLAFALAFALGIHLAFVGGWPIVVVGLCSLAAGWAYSGGPRPISYSPFGELFVLVFFGLVAVGGTYFLQAGAVTKSALVAGLAVGAPAAAVLMVNNLRDIAADTAAGRRTLAAVIGPAASRRVHATLLLAPFALLPLFAPGPWAWLALLALPKSAMVARRAQRAEGAELNPVLADTARTQLLFGVLFAIGCLLS